jgi:NAD(P)H-flavin reductase
MKNCPADILSLHSEQSAINSTQRIEKAHRLTKPEHSAVIEKLNMFDESILEITFKINSETVEFIPGQFILVKMQENPRMNRAYSISGFDPETKTLRITVKKVLNGYGSNILFNLFKEGDEVTLEGPLGYELNLDISAKNILLVAGGIGITPFLPMLKDLHDTNFTGNVHFIHGVNKESELLYVNEIESLLSDNIKYTPVVAFDENYQGEKGFVTDILEKLTLNDTKIYMCGPKPMVSNAEKLLEKMNFNMKNLFVESG